MTPPWSTGELRAVSRERFCSPARALSWVESTLRLSAAPWLATGALTLGAVLGRAEMELADPLCPGRGVEAALATQWVYRTTELTSRKHIRKNQRDGFFIIFEEKLR